MKRANSSHKMVGRCGLEPQMYLTSRIYSALPSPLGYLPIKGRWSNFFITWYASLIGVLCLWYSTGIRLLSTCCTSPHKFVGSLRKDQTHLATTCFGTLIHHPIAHIGTIGITYWDSNPYLPVLETGVLPIKLRLHIMAGRVGLAPTLCRLTGDRFTI